MKLRFPRLFYNAVSLTGTALFLITALAMAAFFFGGSKEGPANPYTGIVVYMILPPLALLGLLLIPIGIHRYAKRLREKGEDGIERWPSVDLNRPSHRRGAVIFVVVTVIYLGLATVGSYEAYHYTESVEFCGTTCHSVMKPEHTAYQLSSHARVACTACHVGEGASFYTKSKINGAYQVYATAFNKYPRPIPTPVHNLRPAKETCERCHWPERFIGSQGRDLTHYMYDEDNTEWPIHLLVKTGGGDPHTGQAMGIHWHVNVGVEVDYIARDEQRQRIPWIRYTDRETGEVVIYQDADRPLSAEEIAAAEPRRMDCMDCHNRPSHKFPSPDHSIDRALEARTIPRDLPEIKRLAVETMAETYETEDEALQAIAAGIPEFYEEDYPEIAQARAADIQRAVASVQRAFSQTIFPEMKARWDVYPDNIGHFSNPGCYRCHDGNKVADDGRVITQDCEACHTIIAQGAGDRQQFATSLEHGLEFVHPEDIDEEWRETGCYECHEGTQP